jgi:transcriptional regulator with XRE-family HTH domain
MRLADKKKAIILRSKGLTYKEIKDELSISKSTLSSWLHDITLTEVQKQRIYNKNIDIRKKFIEYNSIKHKKSVKRKSNLFLKSQREIKKISSEELKLVGIALYWAEGSKSIEPGIVIFANSDPIMISLIMRWFREICNVEEGKFRLKVQAYENMDIKRSESFWSSLTGISQKQFIKPYIKQSKYSKLRRGNTLPHGTLHIRVCDVNLLTKILGWINGFKASSSSSV